MVKANKETLKEEMKMAIKDTVKEYYGKAKDVIKEKHEAYKNEMREKKWADIAAKNMYKQELEKQRLRAVRLRARQDAMRRYGPVKTERVAPGGFAAFGGISGSPRGLAGGLRSTGDNILGGFGIYDKPVKGFGRKKKKKKTQYRLVKVI